MKSHCVLFFIVETQWKCRQDCLRIQNTKCETPTHYRYCPCGRWRCRSRIWSRHWASLLFVNHQQNNLKTLGDWRYPETLENNSWQHQHCTYRFPWIAILLIAWPTTKYLFYIFFIQEQKYCKRTNVSL